MYLLTTNFCEGSSVQDLSRRCICGASSERNFTVSLPSGRTGEAEFGSWCTAALCTGHKRAQSWSWLRGRHRLWVGRRCVLLLISRALHRLRGRRCSPCPITGTRHPFVLKGFASHVSTGFFVEPSALKELQHRVVEAAAPLLQKALEGVFPGRDVSSRWRVVGVSPATSSLPTSLSASRRLCVCIRRGREARHHAAACSAGGCRFCCHAGWATSRCV